VPRRAKIRPDEPGRARVLEAGLEVFGERGYDAASIAEIGERAAISKSVLYHYFDSKARLYEAVLEAETGALLERVAAAVPVDPEAPRLRAGVDAYLGFLAQRPAAWRLFLRGAPADPNLAAVYERFVDELAAGLTTLMATPGKRRRARRHVDLVATGIRAFATWWYEHPDVPRKAVTEAILDFASAGTKHISGSASR